MDFDDDPDYDWTRIRLAGREAADAVRDRHDLLKAAADRAERRDAAWKLMSELGLGHTDVVKMTVEYLPASLDLTRADGMSPDNVRRIVGRIRTDDD